MNAVNRVGNLDPRTIVAWVNRNGEAVPRPRFVFVRTILTDKFVRQQTGTAAFTPTTLRDSIVEVVKLVQMELHELSERACSIRRRVRSLRAALDGLQQGVVHQDSPGPVTVFIVPVLKWSDGMPAPTDAH